MVPMQTKTVQIVDDSRRALQRLRGALIELYAGVRADPAQPQQVSRQFGLNKNLTWKISRVINATDPFASLQHMPGESGLDIALDAFERAGAEPNLIENVRAALRGIDEVASLHAGDRPHLEMILDSMGLLGTPTRLESSRELAFRGNSAIWGVQAKARLTCCFAAPGRDPSKLDLIVVGGFAGLRRLRQTSPWRLFRFAAYHDDGTPRGDPEDEIVPRHNGSLPRLLHRFCSPNMPKIDIATRGTAAEYMLPSGPVGNMGAFDCFFGEISRGAPAYRTERDHTGEFSSTVSLPVETLIFDIILHKDVPMVGAPSVGIYGFPQGFGDNIAAHRAEWELPLGEPLLELAGMPPTVATPLIPRYTELVNTVYERMGWKPSDFYGLRMTLKHPPMQSLAVVKWELPEKK